MTAAALDHSLDDEAFRRVMAALAAGVAVVTTVDADGVLRGLTTTAVTSVSLDPPLLLVCIGRESRTLPGLRSSRRFAVNFIDAACAPVAHHFASKAEDKFVGIAWRSGVNGCPLLDEHSVAWAECRTEREVEAGDHVVLIARIERGGSADDERLPLTYHRRSYGAWSALPRDLNGSEQEGVGQWQALRTR